MDTAQLGHSGVKYNIKDTWHFVFLPPIRIDKAVLKKLYTNSVCVKDKKLIVHSIFLYIIIIFWGRRAAQCLTINTRTVGLSLTWGNQLFLYFHTRLLWTRARVDRVHNILYVCKMYMFVGMTCTSTFVHTLIFLSTA